MATRNEIQIAQDIIKFTNVMNDLLDCLSWQLQEIDPNTGGTLKIKPEGEAERNYTTAELKDVAVRTVANALGYRNQMVNFLAKTGMLALATTGLTALGVDRAVVVQEVSGMKSVCDYLTANIPGAADKAALAQVGAYISTNVPKLKLVRRAWAV